MLIKNAQVLDGDFRFINADLKIQDGKIQKILPQEIDYSGSEGDDIQILDMKDHYVVPGFIDVHTHGCLGFDTMDADYDDFSEMSAFMAKNGITSFLPTSMSASYNDLVQVAENLKMTIEKGTDGANILGLYMEGPYFNVKYKGAQKADTLRSPSFSEFQKLQEISGNHIRVISLAPELDGAIDFVKKMTSQNDVVVSLGHTYASYDEAKEAIRYGAQSITHLFNAMRTMKHRDPGIIGAAFESNVTVELICDGIHLHPTLLRLVYRLKGVNRMLLVSDSMRATCLKDGTYSFGGQQITVNEGIAKTEEGNLAGSTATLFQCFQNAVKFGIPVEDALKMVTYNPARLIGAEKQKGSIKKGKDADLLILDKDYNLVSTIVGGKQYEVAGSSKNTDSSDSKGNAVA